MSTTIEVVRAIKNEYAKENNFQNWEELLAYHLEKKIDAGDEDEIPLDVIIEDIACRVHTRKLEEAGRELDSELKDGDETLVAKLRNALSPHYGLPSVISKIREHSEVLKIAEDMSEQAMKNNLRINTLLNAIDSQLEAKDKEIEELKVAIEKKEDMWQAFHDRGLAEKDKQLQEAKEQVKHSEETRNLCAQQCEHKNKLILEVCAERDTAKAEIERLKGEVVGFAEWIHLHSYSKTTQGWIWARGEYPFPIQPKDIIKYSTNELYEKYKSISTGDDNTEKG